MAVMRRARNETVCSWLAKSPVLGRMAMVLLLLLTMEVVKRTMVTGN
jgi:hypothetical protein